MSSFMGGAKNQMMQEDEQGWSFTDKSVCGRCVNEEALESILEEEADARFRCNFCGGAPAASLNVLLQAFANGLRNEYEDAIDSAPWEGREGGFQVHPQWDTWELVDDFAEVFVGEGLLTVVQDAMHLITWVENDWATRRRDVVFNEAWDRFCEAVKFKTRFVFWMLTEDNGRGAGEIPPAKILDQVGQLVARLSLIRVLPPGYPVWRAQAHNEPEIDHSASRLGTAPRKDALTANRMSPAGIPMFYGSTDLDTAISEVACHSHKKNVTWGQFELTADLPVVDFTLLPPVPSMFDPDLGSLHRHIEFFHRFVDQLSGRVQPRYEQIDYVPTQIVTEYLLRVHSNGESPRGLIYKSYLADEECLVLDIPNDHCIDPTVTAPQSQTQLRLIAGSVGSRPITQTDCPE